jgi:hypothetical protein
MLTVKVKNEVELDLTNKESALPPLPCLPDTLDNVVQVDEVQEPESKRAKIQCSDSVEWLDDVCMITGESTILKVVLVKSEINKYFDIAQKESDKCLTLLEWWKENEYQFP